MFGDMSIIQVFQSSPTMVVLLVCSIVTVAYAVERTMYFMGSRTSSATAFSAAPSPKASSSRRTRGTKRVIEHDVGGDIPLFPGARAR